MLGHLRAWGTLPSKRVAAESLCSCGSAGEQPSSLNFGTRVTLLPVNPTLANEVVCLNPTSTCGSCALGAK